MLEIYTDLSIEVTEFSLDVMTSDNHDTLKHKFKNPSSIGTLETTTLVASEVRDMTEMFGICGIFFSLVNILN